MSSSQIHKIIMILACMTDLILSQNVMLVQYFGFLCSQWVGMWSVIVAFPGLTHVLLDDICRNKTYLSYVCHALLPCGHLLGKGWPLGSCL